MTVVGALSLADLVHCEDAIELTPPTTVHYELFTNQRGAQEFRGIACRRVRNELILTGNFWYGSYAIDRRQTEEIVSPAECYYMKETLNCLENKMSAREGASNVWEYTKQPEGEPRWNTESVYKETNCIVEEITLHRECNDCPIITSYGSLGKPSEAFIVLNHITIVWHGMDVKQRECEFRRIGVGSGVLDNVKGEYPYRLKDVALQMNYLLSEDVVTPCIKNFNGTVKRLRGSESIYVKIAAVGAKKGTITKPSANFEEEARELLTAHLQYEEDEAIARENVLATELNSVYCKTNKNERNIILETARSSGVLAAKQLGLPDCYSVQTSRETAVVFKCDKLRVNVSAERSSCGWQPRYLNYSIAQDGYRLVPYSSCVWTSSYAELNGHMYGIQNNSWKIIEPNMKRAHQIFINHFNVTADESIKWLPQTHHQDHLYMDPANAMADWLSTLHDHGVKRLSELSEMTGPAVNFFMKTLSNWWGISKEALGIIALVGVAIFILMIVALCRGLCGACCCRLTKCSTLLCRYSREEMESFRTPVGANRTRDQQILPYFIGRVESTTQRGNVM
jgi:hypothetical protein